MIVRKLLNAIIAWLWAVEEEALPENGGQPGRVKSQLHHTCIHEQNPIMVCVIQATNTACIGNRVIEAFSLQLCSGM